MDIYIYFFLFMHLFIYIYIYIHIYIYIFVYLLYISKQTMYTSPAGQPTEQIDLARTGYKYLKLIADD